MKKLKKTLIRLVVLALLAHIWCCARFHKEDWQIASSRIPPAFDGFRITLLTDLHGAKFGENGTMLLEAVAACDPDVIAFSGDIVDRWTRDVAVLAPMLQGLCEIAPVYYVTGNHEWDRDDTEALLSMIEDCGVHVLRGQWVTLEQDGQQIVLAGMEDPNGYADQTTPQELMDKLSAAVPGDPYTAVLYHRNTELSLWAQLGADLVLSGHGHGGVIRLPVIGGVLGTDRELFPEHCLGVYEEGSTAMAVSGGLAGVRLWNRPHIPTVVLKSVNIS